MTNARVMSASLPAGEPMFFTKADWGFRPDGSFPKPPPGSWCEPSANMVKQGVLGFYCCPKCGGVRGLHARYHRVDKDGKATFLDGLDIACGTDRETGKKCEFRRVSYFLKWNKNTLWAAALERLENGKYNAVMRYTSAKTAVEARRQFIVGPRDKVVAIAPVIGYYVEDKVGNLLNVD